ncbi:hypothetical protein LROSL1_1203 [Furfurilactobacillus rossiae]|uniref:hypothetical protein n=1 Tax=Furfurilactobacillus rossiae TaxID=231049 RepID=UPI0015BCAFAB|nr:hypothetical protein [Furfurilactobacillus rossiae]QLE64020.1 hypothetical protein LROSL1_1203 [Furfurilactobacillus rossiae]
MAEQTKNGNSLTPEELASPFEWNLADPDLMGNNIVVDLSKSSSLVYRIPTKATQGDNGRELTFALRDGIKKHVITPTTQVIIEAIGGDKFKYGVGTHDAVKDGKGLVTVPLDQEFFEAHGYLYAQLVVMDPPTLVSTVPLRMEVANNPFITAVTNADFASPIKKKLDEVTQMISDALDRWKLSEQTLDQAYGIAVDKLNDMLAKVAAGDFAKLKEDNIFAGKQTFGKGVNVSGGLTADTITLADGTRPLYPKDFNPLGKSGFQNLPGTLLNGWTQATYTFGYWFAMINPETQEGLLKLEGNASYNADIQPYTYVDLFSLDSSFPFIIQDAWELGTGNNFLSGFGQSGWMAYYQNKISVHSREQMIPKNAAIPLSLELHAIYTGGK